jgi:purine-nucleoside phosphorylase
MSTVAEALAARHMGLDVLGLSCISNKAGGVLARPLDHVEVLEAARRVRRPFAVLIEEIVSRL